VEACPTGALGLSGHPVAGASSSPKVRDAETLPSTDVPGFVDPGGARPGLFLIPPVGGIRGARYHDLLRFLAGAVSGGEEDDRG